jgi:polyphosphate kinase
MTEQQTIRAVPTPAPEPQPPSDLDDPKLYDNRELSWLTFNERVLELSEQDDQPLLERLKFGAIFTSNLDEFFMIRVAGLHDQVDAGLSDPAPTAARRRRSSTSCGSASSTCASARRAASSATSPRPSPTPASGSSRSTT